MSHLLYRQMLALYPAELRQQYGSEMLAQFIEDWREARARGLAARLEFWFRIAVDWARSVLLAHGDITKQDLNAAWGNLSQRPGTAIGLTLLLSVTIALNAMGITLADRILVKPLPIESRGLLVFLAESREAGSFAWLSVPRGFADTVRRNSHTLEDAAAISGDVLDDSDGTPRHLAFATPALFEVLAMKPAAGRLFGDGERNAVVLGPRIWAARYGRSSSAIGKTLRFGGRDYRIAGALSEGPDDLFDADVWASQEANSGEFGRVLARIRPGYSLPDAQREWEGLRNRVEGYWPAELAPLRRVYRDPVFDYMTWGSVAIFFLVLLLACVCLVSIQLGQTARRRRDHAIRLALGAPRSRMARLALTESLTVTLLAGLISLPITGAAISGFRGAFDSFGAHRLAGWTTVQFDGMAVALTIGLSALAGTVTALAPTWCMAARDPWAVLSGRQSQSWRVRERLTSILLSTQVGLAALILFIAATFSIEGFHRLDAPQARYFHSTWSLEYGTGARTKTWLRGVSDRLEATGHHLIVTSTTPFGNEPAAIECEAEGRRQITHVALVNGGFFDIPGFRWIQGRPWTESEAVRRELPPIVISESLALRAGVKLGDVLVLLNANGHRVADQVAGVIQPPALDMYKVWPESLAFVPWQQGSMSGISLLADGAPSAMEAALASGDQGPKPLLRSFESRIRRNGMVWEGLIAILWCSGLMALSLASIGSAAWLTQCFSEHGQEIALRCAVGSPATGIWIWAARRIWRPVAVGLIAGLSPGCAIFLVPSRLLPPDAATPALAGFAAAAAVAAFWSAVLWVGSAGAAAKRPVRGLRNP
jgi:hypothetical protein